MSADSLVLIDEVVIADEGAHVWPAGLDLQMYTLFGASERTASQWDSILERAGLRPVAVKKYSPVMGSSVIFAAPKLVDASLGEEYALVDAYVPQSTTVTCS